MTPDVIVVLQFLAFLNFAALVFIAWRLRAPIQVHIHQPPMTVQSPPAILPPELMDLMRSLDDKLKPAALPPVTDTQLDKLVEEGVLLAERRTGAKGPDKFRVARNHVLDSARGLGLTLDERALALRIEAVVLAQRHPKKGG